MARRGRIAGSGCSCRSSTRQGLFSWNHGTCKGLAEDEHMTVRKLSRSTTASRRRSSSKTLFAYASQRAVMPSSKNLRPRTSSIGATQGSSMANRRRLPPMRPLDTLPLKRPRSRLRRSSWSPASEATRVQKSAHRRSLWVWE